MPIEVNRLCLHCHHPRWTHADPVDVPEGDMICDFNEGQCEGCWGFMEGGAEFICDWSDEEEEIGCGRPATHGDFCRDHGLH